MDKGVDKVILLVFTVIGASLVYAIQNGLLQ